MLSSSHTNSIINSALTPKVSMCSYLSEFSAVYCFLKGLQQRCSKFQLLEAKAQKEKTLWENHEKSVFFSVGYKSFRWMFWNFENAKVFVIFILLLIEQNFEFYQLRTQIRTTFSEHPDKKSRCSPYA